MEPTRAGVDPTGAKITKQHAVPELVGGVQLFPLGSLGRREDLLAREIEAVVEVAEPDHEIVFQGPQHIRVVGAGPRRCRAAGRLCVISARRGRQRGPGILRVVRDQRLERFQIVGGRHRAQRLFAKEDHPRANAAISPRAATTAHRQARMP